MTKELLVKVGYVLGTTQGLDQAAKKADDTAKSMKQSATAAQQVVAAGADTVNQKLEETAKKQGDRKSKTGIVGAIDKGLSEVAGAFGAFKFLAGIGAVGATVGKISSDAQMFGSGGAMLRGHGLTGMITGISDFFTGRGTKEALQDLRMGQQDFYTSRMETNLQRLFERQTETRMGAVRPITEVDPLRRQQMERERLTKLQIDTQADMGNAIKQFGKERDTINAGRFMVAGKPGTKEASDLESEKIKAMLRSGNAMAAQMEFGQDRVKKAADSLLSGKKDNDFVDELGNLKINLAESKAIIQYKTQLKDLAKQELDLAAQQFQAKKEMVRGSQLSFGAMTPMEQEFALRSAERLKGGEQLAPEEISSLSGLGIASDALNKMFLERSKQGGFSRLAATVGDEEVSKAGREDLRVGGGIDIHLESGQRTDSVFKRTQEVIKQLQDEIDKTVRKQQEMEAIIHNKVTIDRKLQVPGG